MAFDFVSCRDPKIGGEPTPQRGQIAKAQLVASLENYERNDVSRDCARFSWHWFGRRSARLIVRWLSDRMEGAEAEGGQEKCAHTITLLSGPGRPAQPWRTDCRQTRATRCCC